MEYLNQTLITYFIKFRETEAHKRSRPSSGFALASLGMGVSLLFVCLVFSLETVGVCLVMSMEGY